MLTSAYKRNTCDLAHELSSEGEKVQVRPVRRDIGINCRISHECKQRNG